MVKIKNLNPSFELKYQTEGSVGIDLASREDIVIPAGTVKLVPLGVIVETPEDCMTALLPRSSLFKKKSLVLANSVGVIDRDYNGPQDEIMAQLYNMSDSEVIISKNERICQIILVNVSTPEIVLVDEVSGSSRGGFGSTGD